jgi:hypothetical protein
MGKIAVLGLGPSLSEFKPEEFELSIGVNDIWRYFKSEVVICLNHPKEFKPDRLKVINECSPQAFYSQMVIWDTRPDFRKIDLLTGYPDTFINLSSPSLHKSYCSPFVAVQIAYRYYNANEIHLFGVDLLNHPFLNQALCAKIKIHFFNLKIALAVKDSIMKVHGEGILKDI